MIQCFAVLAVAVWGLEQLPQSLPEYAPPSIEVIVDWYKPVPSFDEVTAPIQDRPDAPWKRLLVGDSEEEIVRVAESRFLELADLGRFDEALKNARSALEIRRRQQGDRHPRVVELAAIIQWFERVASLPESKQAQAAQARALDRRVNELEQSGELPKAVEALHEALRIRAETSGTDSWDYANSLYDLAFFAAACGQNALASRSYRECIDRRARLLGRDHPQLALSLSNFGYFLDSVGEYESSEQLIRVALGIRRAAEGPQSPYIPNLLASLALARTRRGDVITAEGLFRRAVEEARSISQSGPDTLAGIVGNAGFFFKMIGKYADAELLLRESLALHRARFGDAHPETAYRRQELACLLQDLGDFGAAEEAYRAALTGLENSLGPEHRLSILAKLNLATLLADSGRPGVAEDLLRDGEFESRLSRTQDVRLRRARFQALGSVALDQGHVEDAIAAFRAGQSISAESGAVRDSNSAMVLVGLALALNEVGSLESHDEAVRCSQEAVALLQSLQSPQLYDARMAIARIQWREVERTAEVEKHLMDAADLYETLQSRIGGDELDQANFAKRYTAHDPFSALALLKLDQSRAEIESSQGSRRAEAFGLLERGRARALLNLIDRGARQLRASPRTNPDGEQNEPFLLELQSCEVRRAEASARLSVAQAELLSDPEGPTRTAKELRVKEAADAERQALRDRNTRLRQKFGANGASAWSASEVAKRMLPSELVLSYQTTEKRADLLVLRAGGEITHHRLAWSDGSDITDIELSKAVTQFVTQISNGTGETAARANKLRRALIPAELGRDIAMARVVFVVPDRPILGLPFELLFCQSDDRSNTSDAMPVIAYGPSATLLMKLRETRAIRGSPNTNPAVLLGDPSFLRVDPATTQRLTPVAEPDDGALISAVAPGSNGERSGLRPGDVILMYGAKRLRTPADLDAFVRTATASSPTSTPASSVSASGTTANGVLEIPISVWREGVMRDINVAPGTLGVELSPLKMPDAADVQRQLGTPSESRAESLRLGAARRDFGHLSPLPGSRAEVAAIADRLQKAGMATPVMLVGEHATLPNLSVTARQPRFLHLATHGAVRGGPRIWESALALAPVGAGDAGFLRLFDLLESWGGRLDGTELVVLSGCQTALGQSSGGEGFVGLTWGFLYAGAESVIASLWKVDDGATLLLMDRFYENVTGTFASPRRNRPPGGALPKAEALEEAKSWLRRQSSAEVRDALARLHIKPDQLIAARDVASARRPSADPRPPADPFNYADPRYWAAFVLIGNPD